MDATTFPVECRHCGNKGTMRILAEARETEEYEDNSDPRFPLEWEAGNIYQTLRCYTCHQVTFYQFSVHTGTDPEYIDRSDDQTLYPSAAESPMGLPATIQREWDAALRVRRVSPNAFAVLLGRVLDQICTDHKAEGRFLHNRIEHLASSGKLPEPLTKGGRSRIEGSSEFRRTRKPWRPGPERRSSARIAMPGVADVPLYRSSSVDGRQKAFRQSVKPFRPAAYNRWP